MESLSRHTSEWTLVPERANELPVTNMTLPDQFKGAIAAWLTSNSPGSRRAGTAALTATYRAGGTSREADLAAYLVARLPATYAAVTRVLDEVARLRPEFLPSSLLDAGSGPGTAAWAAVQVWESPSDVTFLDVSPDFLRLAADLAAQGRPPLSSAHRMQGSIEMLPETVRADLVVASYALAELPLSRVARAAGQLWTASRSMLALIEPGTPEGFARIAEARTVLLAQGAVPVAPCTHAGACPMTGGDWCHFSVRLARSRAHMHAKAASVPFEDERFSYLILARDGQPAGGARVLAPPRHGKPGIDLKLCGDGQVEIRHVARRDVATYKHAKKLDWGDILFRAPREESDE